MKKLGSVLAVLILAAGAAWAAADAARPADATKKPAAHKTAKKEMPVVMPAADIQWTDAPAVLPAGAKFAVLHGNPMAAGPFTIRLQMPDGYKIMPHWHPTDEAVTVISGEFDANMGDKFDETGAHSLPAGSFALMPAHMHHFGFAKGDTTVQVSGMGPFKLVYVNPADDPSGMQGKKAAPKKATKKAA